MTSDVNTHTDVRTKNTHTRSVTARVVVASRLRLQHNATQPFAICPEFSHHKSHGIINVNSRAEYERRSTKAK